ncbi:LOW QUALITY PROTEIN: thiamine transporter 2 [Cyprinus carpio]|uniref:LOW QUALITY PROTEIN: thiamine transporter 2 n=1 Tax=Cyprinus carpio TaxID=7962 RepID=A0A9Q9X683_CYPCA|nr:LOW QUALITY PROTEIN: thiamine transporter 2 [Cyprinus carpio]
MTCQIVTNQIFPVWTYSYLAVLVPVFLLTDWLRYKPVVVFQCLVSLFSTTAMLLWCNGVPEMQAMQFTYGVVTSCDVAYFTYLYSMVELKHYLKATSYYCRGPAQLLGVGTSGSVLGQILVSFELMSYNNILVFTLVLTGIALIGSILLPMPKTSMFFHKMRRARGETDGEGHVGTEEDLQSTGQKDGVEMDGAKRQQQIPEVSAECDNTSAKSSKTDIPHSFSPHTHLISSQCCAHSTQTYNNQTVNYVQSLWEYVEPSSNFTVYNGGVEALSNLFGAAAAYGIGFSSADWSRYGEVALGALSALEGGALFAMVFSANIWVCYCGYIIFKSLYMLLITIAMFQIAAGLNLERYALVFGANTFCALVLQTIITSVVVDSGGLGVDIITQFTVYGAYFSIIALIFFLSGLYTTICRKPEMETPRENPEETFKAEDDAQIIIGTKF